MIEVVLGLLMLLGAYYYGVRVGYRAGVPNGRRQADSEWARMLENGMV